MGATVFSNGYSRTITYKRSMNDRVYKRSIFDMYFCVSFARRTDRFRKLKKNYYVYSILIDLIFLSA